MDHDTETSAGNEGGDREASARVAGVYTAATNSGARAKPAQPQP